MIKLHQVCKHYQSASRHKRTVTAVDTVSFSLFPHTSYALVGESGCGKTTLAMMIAALIPPTSGTITYNGHNIWNLSRAEKRYMRKNLQLVLQDSKGALNPRKKIYDTLAEPLQNLCTLSKTEIRKAITNTLQKTLLDESFLSRYPHELSGGQQSRICIARAICLKPAYMIFDESSSALDVLVRKKVLDLLRIISKEHKTTTLFITHDIEAALYMADHVLVMKDGRIVEIVYPARSYDSFQHPYAKELIAALLPETLHNRAPLKTRLDF